MGCTPPFALLPTGCPQNPLSMNRQSKHRPLPRRRVGWGDFLVDTEGGLVGARQWTKMACCKELSTRNPLITLGVHWSDVRWTDGTSESQTNAPPIMNSFDRPQLPGHRNMEPDLQPCKHRRKRSLGLGKDVGGVLGGHPAVTQNRPLMVT